MNNTNKKVYFDILNTIACLMVVYFHCNGIFYEYSNTISWKISVVERCIVYSAVPIFFMLTGAKLLNYREKYSTKEYAKKRIIRTGIPFLFWNLFYVGLMFITGTFKYSITEFVSAFINSDFQVRYWFFFPLFAIYASIPFLSVFLKLPEHRKYLWYLVGISFVISWFLKPILHLFDIDFNNYLNFPLSDGFLIFSVFGYLVSTGEWKKKYRILLYIFTFLSEIFVISYTIISSSKYGSTNQYMVNYHFFPSALFGASIFVFFRHLIIKNISEKTEKFLKILANCNMGVWLTHSLAITLVVKISGLGIDSYFIRFIAPIIIYVLCVTGTYITKKIPLLKFLV